MTIYNFKLMLPVEKVPDKNWLIVGAQSVNVVDGHLVRVLSKWIPTISKVHNG